MRRAQGTALVPNRIVLRVAKAARAHKETVRKVIAGLPVRGRVAEDVKRELQRRRVTVPAGGSDGSA